MLNVCSKLPLSSFSVHRFQSGCSLFLFNANILLYQQVFVLFTVMHQFIGDITDELIWRKLVFNHNNMHIKVLWGFSPIRTPLCVKCMRAVVNAACLFIGEGVWHLLVKCRRGKIHLYMLFNVVPSSTWPSGYWINSKGLLIFWLIFYGSLSSHVFRPT